MLRCQWKSLFRLFIILFGFLYVGCPVDAQETFVSKKDADFVFGLSKPKWEEISKSYFAPGVAIKSVPHDSGSQVIALDPTTGVSLSVQPFFNNDSDPPVRVVIGNYFPLGILPAVTEEMQKQMRAGAQRDLGEKYTVQLDYSKTEKFEIIELRLTQNK
jgi:hypothetical protein